MNQALRVATICTSNFFRNIHPKQNSEIRLLKAEKQIKTPRKDDALQNTNMSNSLK